MSILTFVFRTVLSLLVGLVVGWAWWMLERPRRIKYILGIGVVFAVGTFGGLAELRGLTAKQVVVQIVSPSSETSVGEPEVIISGTVAPSMARVYILVHPVNSNRWWVQAPVVLEGVDTVQAKWKSKIQLGTETQGAREAFEVVAVASQEPLWLDVLAGRYLRTGDQVLSLPPQSHSVAITLRRGPK